MATPAVSHHHHPNFTGMEGLGAAYIEHSIPAERGHQDVGVQCATQMLKVGPPARTLSLDLGKQAVTPFQTLHTKQRQL